MEIITHPDYMKTGYSIVMRILRGKDGGLAKPDHRSKKIITSNPDEWNEAVRILQESAEPQERIYASADARSMEKAIYEFRRRELEAELLSQEAREGFYLDIKNRFVSCLASPSTRITKHFIIDCDTPEEIKEAGNSGIIQQNMLYGYKTKNGIHVVTNPFNPSLTSLKDKIVKSGMILVGY